jgi:hypothetical protein
MLSEAWESEGKEATQVDAFTSILFEFLVGR